MRRAGLNCPADLAHQQLICGDQGKGWPRGNHPTRYCRLGNCDVRRQARRAARDQQGPGQESTPIAATGVGQQCRGWTVAAARVRPQMTAGRRVTRFGLLPWIRPVRWDLPRPTTTLLLMAEFAEEQGASADACPAGTGLTTTQLRRPGPGVTARQELTLIVRMMETSRRGRAVPPQQIRHLGIRAHQQPDARLHDSRRRGSGA